VGLTDSGSSVADGGAPPRNDSGRPRGEGSDEPRPPYDGGCSFSVVPPPAALAAILPIAVLALMCAFIVIRRRAPRR
jgi:hypothetical protein